MNLSVGGVSLQAAAKLNNDTDLALNFRLEAAEKPIETVGCIAWLDPSQKGAGISFKDLPASTEQKIADWIASQEQPAWNAHSEPKPHTTPTAGSEPPRPPIQASVPAIFPSEKPASARPGFVPGILDKPLSEPVQQNAFGSATAAPPPVSVLPALPFRTPPEEQFEPSTGAPLEFPAKPYGLPLKALTPTTSVGAPQVLPRDVLLPDPVFPAHAVVAVAPDRLVPATPATLDSSASQLHRRRKLAIGLAAGMIGILGLVVTVSSIKRPPEVDDSGAQTAQPVSPAEAALPESAPPAKAKGQTGRAVGAARSRTPSTDVDAATPVRVAVAPVHPDGSFMEGLRSLLGLDAVKTIDPATAALPVWTVQHSGFYYCSHSPEFRTLEPGAIMTQGQALQSGYQPKIGDYCK